MKERLLTVKEVAEILRYNPAYLRAKIKKGEIPGVVRIGRAIRIKKSALEALLAGEDTSQSPETKDGN